MGGIDGEVRNWRWEEVRDTVSEFGDEGEKDGSIWW